MAVSAPPRPTTPTAITARTSRARMRRTATAMPSTRAATRPAVTQPRTSPALTRPAATATRSTRAPTSRTATATCSSPAPTRPAATATHASPAPTRPTATPARSSPALTRRAATATPAVGRLRGQRLQRLPGQRLRHRRRPDLYPHVHPERWRIRAWRRVPAGRVRPAGIPGGAVLRWPGVRRRRLRARIPGDRIPGEPPAGRLPGCSGHPGHAELHASGRPGRPGAARLLGRRVSRSANWPGLPGTEVHQEALETVAGAARVPRAAPNIAFAEYRSAGAAMCLSPRRRPPHRPERQRPRHPPGPFRFLSLG